MQPEGFPYTSFKLVVELLRKYVKSKYLKMSNLCAQKPQKEVISSQKCNLGRLLV